MKKIFSCYSYVLSLVLLATGCATFKNTVPDGFNRDFAFRKVIIKINDLQFDKFNTDYARITPDDTPQMNDLFKKDCRAFFLRSSRFDVLAEDAAGMLRYTNAPGGTPRILAEVTPHIVAKTASAGVDYKKGGKRGIVCHTRLFVEFIEFEKDNTVWNKAPRIDGRSVILKVPILSTGFTRIKPHDLRTQMLFSSEDALSQLEAELNELFPITCLVLNWKDETFYIQGGTNDGMSSADDITLYYAHEGEPLVLLANMKNKIVGAGESTMTAGAWNSDDPRARELRAKIKAGSKDLEGCLFIVCNKH